MNAGGRFIRGGPAQAQRFGSESTDKSGDEIVLSITPRLVRNTPHPEAGLVEFASGTDDNVRAPEVTRTMPAAAPALSAAASTLPAASSPVAGAAAPVGVVAVPQTAVPASTGAAASGVGTATAGQVAPPPSVSMNWAGPTAVAPGTIAQQQLVLTAPRGVGSVSLTIGYDPAALQVTSVSEGTLLKSDGATTTFSQRIDSATGQIHVTTVRAPNAASGALGQGSIAVLNLKPIATGGTSTLRVLSVAATAPDGTPMDVAAPPDQPLFISGKTLPP